MSDKKGTFQEIGVLMLAPGAEVSDADYNTFLDVLENVYLAVDNRQFVQVNGRKLLAGKSGKKSLSIEDPAAKFVRFVGAGKMKQADADKEIDKIPKFLLGKVSGLFEE